MEQLSFNDIIEKITDKLRGSDDDTISDFYNTMFEIPIQCVGDDTWEEIVDDEDVVVDDVIDEDFATGDFDDYDE